MLDETQSRLASLDAASPDYATAFVDLLLNASTSIGASDIHLQPISTTELEICWRLDGVLQVLGVFPFGGATDVITRLKVMAELLTYRNETPQEGRIRDRQSDVEMRVSTFPTLHGERAVVRVFARRRQLHRLTDLGFPADTCEFLSQQIQETAGSIIITGPAGSGKTTTAYACLRELASRGESRRSIVTLEDPVEAAIPGVVQSQVSENVGFDFALGVRSVMRQDPEVILVGEIRDAETAQAAFGASLTGHLVFTTFHAGNSAEAISRLTDMRVEPYVLRSALLAILSQRLLRRLCACAVDGQDSDRLGLPAASNKTAVGCDACHQTGYRGRMLIAELMSPRRPDISAAITPDSDAAEIARRAVADGMITLWRRAVQAVNLGETSAAEVRRVIGFDAQRAEEQTESER